MKKWVASTSASLLAASLMFMASTAALAECIEGSDGRTYSCGGSPQWDFEAGKWKCTNMADGQTVFGDRADCGGGRDAGVDGEDLLEPLVDGPKPRNRPIRPGDPRKRHEVPK